MNTKNFLNFNGVEQKPFRPSTFLNVSMNEFDMRTKDVTTITKWLGLLHLEHLEDDQRKLCGFHVVHASSFASRFLPALLIQALWRDLQNQREHKKPHWFVLQVYARALWLTARFSQTWNVRN